MYSQNQRTWMQYMSCMTKRSHSDVYGKNITAFGSRQIVERSDSAIEVATLEHQLANIRLFLYLLERNLLQTWPFKLQKRVTKRLRLIYVTQFE